MSAQQQRPHPASEGRLRESEQLFDTPHLCSCDVCDASCAAACDLLLAGVCMYGATATERLEEKLSGQMDLPCDDPVALLLLPCATQAAMPATRAAALRAILALLALRLATEANVA